MSLAENRDADDHGLAHARRLVRSIFHQITEGDAPSVNFEGGAALSSRTGNNHGGYARQGSGGRVPLFRASTFSNQSVPSDNQSQDGCNDAASTTASEVSVASSPVSTPKQMARFPPRPPSSSSRKRDMGDAGSSHSDRERLTPSSPSVAPCYSIGASLMGALPLADLCSRTLEARNNGRENGGRNNIRNQCSPGTFPPPPLSPLESEGSSPREDAPAGLGTLSLSNLDSTPRVHNGERTTSALDDQGFPCDERTKEEKAAIVEKLITYINWDAESGSSSSDDGASNERGRNNMEETAPIERSVAPNGNSKPLTVRRSSSNGSANASGGGQRPRIMMFGSEYARILSSSKPLLSPTSASKVKRSSNAVSSKLKKRFSSSLSAAQSNASSAKESVESGGNVVMSLDDCPNAIATAPITDVIVTAGSDAPPRGYYRAFQLGGESIKNMVPGLKRQRLFLNVKKEPNWDRAVQRPCVTAFCVIYPDRNEFVPPGFSVVRLYRPSGGNDGVSKKNDGGSNADSASSAANINLSSSGERVYICYRRSREGNPITGIVCLRPSRGDLIPEGYSVLERTPRNFLADMSAKSDHPSFLAYRQRLENLECLRPLPLVLSVLHSKPDAGRRELRAYYCTGGTTVTSDVGRYHIMDRSTHALLSSSSAQSRLNLIQSSRNESETAVPAWVSSPSTHSASSHLDGDPTSPSATSSKCNKDDSSASDSFDTCLSRSQSQSSLASNMTSTTSEQSLTLTKSTSPGHSFYSQSDDTLQTSLDALHFIPPIECARAVVLQNDDDTIHSESLLQSRVAAITPILTSCYTSQGGSALMAVEGLISLLNNTPFFAQDVAEDDDVDCTMASSERLTILDLAIQVVCDVATTSARETHFRSCVDFVADAVRYARGKLNDRTIGFVLRFYLFVFYFGASIPTSGWPFSNSPRNSTGIMDDFLLSDTYDKRSGGAPQAAAIALKEFMSIMLARIGTGLEKAQCRPISHEDETPHSLAGGIVSTLVENAMNRVDVANYSQLALYQIHRSGGSELFWHDMIGSIGGGLFGQDAAANRGIAHSNIISFAILASIVKISSAKVRVLANDTEPVPRDVASKLLSLELLLHFIKMWHVAAFVENSIIHCTDEAAPENAGTQTSKTFESIATMIYVVRRLVVPSLLSNTSAAIEDCRVYRRVLRIISQLWCNPYYRGQMKIDLAVLIEHFVLKVLCLRPQVNAIERSASNEGSALISQGGGIPTLFQQQLDVLEEIKNWFSTNPKTVLDLYVNYDAPGDMLPTEYCKLMNKICEALSTLAEQCITIISENGRLASIGKGDGSPRRSNKASTASIREAAQSMREKSFEAITAIAKSMMDCTIMSRKHEELATGSTDGEPTMYDPVGEAMSPQMSPAPSIDDENIVDYWKTTLEKRRAPLQLAWPTLSEGVETPLALSIKPSTSEDSTKQTLQQKQESFDVAFDLISTKGLKRGLDYLIASNLLTPSPRHISSFLRIHQSSIDPCILGEYLGEGGIDGADVDFFCLIRFNFARATSFVGMNIEQALRHFLTDCGFRLPGEAQKIDRIISTFSQCYWEDNAGDIQRCPFQDQDTVFLISFAIIMLNTDLHKSHAGKGKTPKRMSKHEFITNLRGVYDGVDKFRGYLYSVYESIEATPIAISTLASSAKTKNEQGLSLLPFKDQPDFAASIQLWVKSVKSAQEILRTVAVRHDTFESVDDPHISDATRDAIARQMFTANWHHIHGAVNAAIDNAHTDLAGLDCCVDVLEYSLCTASYLGMTVERSAFSKLLGRVNRFNDLKVKKSGAKKDEKARNGGHMDFDDVGQVRSLTKTLHQSLSLDDKKIETMKRVASRIRNGYILLNDPSRYFLREGDLVKRHQLAGRSATYRFFLFSDVLVYAHKSAQGADYKVHEELPLHLMKIEDSDSAPSSTRQNSFYINHPNKSFLVVASSNVEKLQWVSDINAAINREVKRKAKMEKSRIEAARRAMI